MNKQMSKYSSHQRAVTRANKQSSTKKIIPTEYLSNPKHVQLVREITEIYGEEAISEVIFSVATCLLGREDLLNRPTVHDVLVEFKEQQHINKNLSEVDKLIPRFSPNEDFLGALCQSLITEGYKNKEGSYYTPKEVVNTMLTNCDLDSDSTFLDPCCGSGAFLMSVRTKEPRNLYGVEKDPIAAFITKINLILQYKEINFEPNIVCADFLSDNVFLGEKTHFDCIATNPPWGNKSKAVPDLIGSRESFVNFFVKSYGFLRTGGKINFLFPEAILNVAAHSNIRRFMMDNSDLHEIQRYSSSFTGVVTEFVSMCFVKGSITSEIKVIQDKEEYQVRYTSFSYTKNRNFSLLRPKEEEIIQKVFSKAAYTLENSQWGMGVITGNNREILKSIPDTNMEKIYTGKDIHRFRLDEAKYYILYDRSSLQQVAREEIYRAKEKLVYKFISDSLVFAYDNSSSLFLNSANILIPNIPNMSIKAVLAFLNSNLYQFLYKKLYGEIKILKGNLSELPFPSITSETDVLLSSLVDKILLEEQDTTEEIDEIICSLFGIEARFQ